MDEEKINTHDENNIQENDFVNDFKIAEESSQNTAQDTKNLNPLPRRFNLVENIKRSAVIVKDTFIRFPLTLIIFAAIASIFIYLIEAPYDQSTEKFLGRIIAVLVMGIPVTLSVNLIIEKFFSKINSFFKLLLYLLQIVLLAGYFQFLFPEAVMVPIMRLALISISFGLAFLFISYLRGKEGFEIFITKIISRAIITCFFTLVIALGLVATLFAVKSLIYNDLSSDFYSYVWILSWCIFAPVYFLSDFPKAEHTYVLKDYTNIQKILLMYIILPILSIYTLVLYVYFGKILITQVWPKGIVSYLVLSYTFAGIISIFLISPFYKLNKWVNIFTKAYLILILPLLGMMFVSIGIRIQEFGFTENRYLILIVGAWAAFAAIFMNFDRNKRNVILPISLAVVAFLTVCGPWDAFNVSIASQNHRLYSILSKNNMVVDGKIAKAKTAINTGDQREITEILRYFDRSHTLSDIKYVPKGFSLEKMKDVFGFELVDTYKSIESDYFNYYRPQDIPKVIDGYNILFGLDFYNSSSNIIYKTSSNSQYGKIEIYINKEYEMTLMRNGEVFYSFNMLNSLSSLYKKYGNQINPKESGKQELISVDSNNKAEIKLIYNEINLTINKDDNKITPSNVKVDLLVKFK